MQSKDTGKKITITPQEQYDRQRNKLAKLGDLGYLDEIENDSSHKIKIPFPYGSQIPRPYGWYLK